VIYNQIAADIRCEWGLRGIEELVAVSEVVIIVDVLSFSTCVDIATQRGAHIYPYRWKDASAQGYATAVGAQLAAFKRTSEDVFTLSPASLQTISKGTKLVLPSPNGATLSLATQEKITLCGSLRNAAAVAAYAMKLGQKIAVIPAGEKWEDGSMRVALEDWLGAGAIIAHLNGKKSPEAAAAAMLFNAFKDNLSEEIKNCSSGIELITRGFEQDVILASELNKSNNVPILNQGCYTAAF